MTRPPLLLTLDLARVDHAEDPFSFRFEPQDYLARTEGGAISRLHLEWDQTWLDDLAALRQPSPSAVVLHRIGERLARFLTDAGWAAQATAIDGVLRAGGAVILTIRSAAAELYTLPWELLTLTPSGQHLGELDGVVIRYEWPDTATVPELRPPRSDGGRILVAWSAAGGGVPAAEHLEMIAAACEAGGRSFDRTRDVVAHASIGALEERLEAALTDGPPIDVLHILCHADGGPEGGLILDGADQRPARVDPPALRRLLRRFAGMIRLVVLAACESADPGDITHALGGLTQLLHRAGVSAVIGSRFPLAVDASLQFTGALYRALAVDLASLEEAVGAGRRRLRGLDPIAWATIQLHARAADGADTRPLVVRPYRGLLSFGPQHRRLFFGRDREIVEIRQDLRGLEERGEPKFLVVAGASGSGKSSVVLGGFVPLILEEREPTWSWALLRPGAAPIDALAAAIGRILGTTITGDPEVITAALLGWREANPERRLLLVVDQLEELFTQGAGADERQRFVRLLWRLASHRRWPIAVISTLRVDFIGRCGEVVVDDEGLRLDRVAYDERHRIFIPRADRRFLREVIEAPARATGLSLEPGLSERILEDVEDEAGALPSVSHALELLWRRRSGRALTQAAYEAIGGVTGALARHAEASTEGLGEAELAQARRLLLRLVSGGGEQWASDTRARLPLDRLRPAGASAPAFDRVVERLTEGRLLVISEAESEPGAPPRAFIEVAHEALIRAWPRLQHWVSEDRQRLVELQRLAAWVADHHDRGTVLDGPRLAFAQEFALRHPDDIDGRTQALIDASVAAHEAASRVEAERRAELERSLHRTRKAAWVAGLVAALALTLVFVTDWILTAFQREALLRLDAPLYALVERMPKDDPIAVLNVLAEIEITDEPAWLAAADDALRRLPEQHLLTTDSMTLGLAVRDDGTIALLSASQDGLLIFRDAATYAPQQVLGPGPFLACAWSPGGALVALAGDGLLEFPPTEDGRLGDPIVRRPLDLAGPTSLVLSSDPRRPLVALHEPEDRRARLFTLAGADEIVIDGQGAPFTAVSFIDDGRALLTASGDLSQPELGGRRLQIWDARTGGLRSTLPLGAGAVLAVTASLDQERIMAITREGELLTWRRAEPDAGPRRWNTGHGPLRAAAFEPTRGERALLATADDALSIQPVAGGPALALPGFAGGPRVALAWTPDGAGVVAADSGGVHLFRADGRHHDPRSMSEGERHARVYEIATCAPHAELERLAAVHGIGDIALRDLCVDARESRLSELLAEGESLLVLILPLIFAGELLIVGIALRRRRSRTLSDPAALRRDLGPPALGLGLLILVLALATGLGFSAMNVLDHDDGSAAIGGAFAAAWLTAIITRLQALRAGPGRRLARVSLRLAQLIAASGALVLGAGSLHVFVSPLTVGVAENTGPALLVFYLLLVTFIGLFVLGLRQISEWLRSPPAASSAVEKT